MFEKNSWSDIPGQIDCGMLIAELHGMAGMVKKKLRSKVDQSLGGSCNGTGV